MLQRVQAHGGSKEVAIVVGLQPFHGSGCDDPKGKRPVDTRRRGVDLLRDLASLSVVPVAFGGRNRTCHCPKTGRIGWASGSAM